MRLLIPRLLVNRNTDQFLAQKKAYQIIDEKNPNLEDKAEVAKKVGVGAVIFGALYNSKIKDIVFSYDKVLNFDGETSVYVQYTCARAKSVYGNKMRNAAREEANPE